jgi:hypothetical protein
VFNKILEKGLTKVCCANRDEWDERVIVVLWSYMITTKKFHKYSPFQLVYGREVVILVDLVTSSLYIAHVTCMIDDESVAERVVEMLELYEARFLVDFC